MKKSALVVSCCALALLAGCAAIDRTERNILVQRNVSPVVYDKMVRGDVLSLNDVIELSQRQVPPNVIIRYLRSTRATYMLDKQGLALLKQGKVCQEVIDYLLSTPALFGPIPPYYGSPWYPYGGYYPYYYGPAPLIAPLPPPVIFVGGRWHR